MDYKSIENRINYHWEYVKGLLESAGVRRSGIECIGYNYKSSALHFTKHTLQDMIKLCERRSYFEGIDEIEDLLEDLNNINIFEQGDENHD